MTVRNNFDDILAEIKGQPILVANRGIPARRICRAIRDRFEAIAVMTATEIDKTAPAAASAQELMLLGTDPGAYLDLDLIISLSKRRGIKAIHPGWGFASEDERFPQLCQDNGIIFIGSTAESMKLLGNKVEVRKLAKKLNIPTVPGSGGAVTLKEAQKIAREIGLPLMLKAEGGGGGRGIIEVNDFSEISDAFAKASTMAQASFNNPRLYVEKKLEKVHHIEIQVIADQHGHVFAFDERDCSVQRNHQKLIEITPSPWPGLTPELRERLKRYSRELVQKVGYHSLCTVEFLVGDDGQPYLIEVNTRLQVEHGITETRYGLDLVEEQISVAFGGQLRADESRNRPSLVAMQVRINLEDPQYDFTPNSGLITRYVSPGGPGVRLDSNLSAGYDFPSNYDSAGALLIAYGQDWPKVLGVMDRALGEYTIGGLKTTIPFFRSLLRQPDFRNASFTTSFLGENPALMRYSDHKPEAERLGSLMAEISAHGYNPFLQLGRYRTAETPSLGPFNPVLPRQDLEVEKRPSPYPRGDRRQLLDYLRDTKGIHFTDTTCRDMTQSNSGNRFRLAEDGLVGPYLDNAGLFSMETGGGAHFHVAMMANMTYPFSEAQAWNKFAPKTLKQILVRSTNMLGYKPQPAELMRLTGEMICQHFHVVRCFDFLNHAENMAPLAKVILSHPGVLFEPSLSLSWGQGFTVEHYVSVVESLLGMCAKVSGLPLAAMPDTVAIGLKDMAGVCPPRFMEKLVKAILKRWPNLVLHYHRHYTDGLFVPSVGAAAKAGCRLVDAALGASVRSYGQGDLLSAAAYIEEELNLPVHLDRDAVRSANFVLKQIMPYYDRYAPTYFNGIDHDVVRHGMPGGATSSSQEGAMKQGYIQFLPQMLRYLSGVRQIVRYHDVTPGSQITWNAAFLAVSQAFLRGGPNEVNDLLAVLDRVNSTPEEKVDAKLAADRLMIYRDCNDAFRELLLGNFGPLPLGFPPDWVYQSAFGGDWETALRDRKTDSPLNYLQKPDLKSERAILVDLIRREPTEEEFVMYLNQPADALKTIRFKEKFGNPNNLPLNTWFEGLKVNEHLTFTDSKGKPHQITLLSIQPQDKKGQSAVRFLLDSEIMVHAAQVGAASPDSLAAAANGGASAASSADPHLVAAPMNGDLWVMYVKEGDLVNPGQELFNISIMKQEKAVTAKISAMVKKIHKTADFKHTKQMVPVSAGELIVELCPVPARCDECQKALPAPGLSFCPFCGAVLAEAEDGHRRDEKTRLSAAVKPDRSKALKGTGANGVGR
ncbi:MAG: pyruvate carboxylase [Deltaproteobacteria bacterium]|jgi:pyruvate carboxylase|nr:pyruvate carboxylase [Deltaproteobacteria bacterium]